MAKKELRIGFMGASWPCRMHAEAFTNIKGVQLTAVSELHNVTRGNFIKSYGEMEQYDDYNEMLEKGNIDIAIIGLPTGLHYQAVAASLKAGCHVLCEKPPTATAAEMKRLVKSAADKKLVYGFSRQFRFNPEIEAARKMVKSRKLGSVYHAEGKWIRARGIPMRESFTIKEKGGGVLLDLGVHVIDNMWFIMGCPKPVEAHAVMHCAFRHIVPKEMKYTADDMSIGTVRFDNGASMNLMVSFALNTAGQGTTSVVGKIKPEWQELKIYGSKGGIDVWGSRFIKGEVKDVDVEPLKLQRNPLPPFEAQARDFIKAVRKNTEPMNSASQAVMLMQMIDALRKSAETGRSVKIR